MDGAVIDVLIEPGARIQQGDTLVVLEAMKMEHPVKAGRDGIAGQLLVSKGDQVRRNQLLMEVTTIDNTEQENA